jgi:hypothetical protein
MYIQMQVCLNLYLRTMSWFVFVSVSVSRNHAQPTQVCSQKQPAPFLLLLTAASLLLGCYHRSHLGHETGEPAVPLVAPLPGCRLLGEICPLCSCTCICAHRWQCDALLTLVAVSAAPASHVRGDHQPGVCRAYPC